MIKDTESKTTSPMLEREKLEKRQLELERKMDLERKMERKMERQLEPELERKLKRQLEPERKLANILEEQELENLARALTKREEMARKEQEDMAREWEEQKEIEREWERVKLEWMKEKENVISKSIEFNAEQYQAGMSILSYFSEIVKSKHPDTAVKVSIEQDGNTVRLHILTEDGYKEVIEKTLGQYAAVISGQATPETLFDSQLEIIALQGKLDVANTEARNALRLLDFKKDSTNRQVNTLEGEVNHLRQQIGLLMNNSFQSSKLLETQLTISSKERQDQAKLLHTTIQGLLNREQVDQKVLAAVSLIEAKLAADDMSDGGQELKEALETIEHEAPTVFGGLKAALVNTTYGVMGNTVFHNIMKFIAAVNKSV